MKNKNKSRKKFRQHSLETNTKDSSEVQTMPVERVETDLVEDAPIESIKTQVHEPNNNNLTSPESINIEVLGEPKDNVVAEETSKSEQKVLESNEVIKHPLETTWGFWLNTNQKRSWADNIKLLTSFDTVEDYWCLYHHMKVPSELSCGQDYAIFKSGIRPMWEDPANKPGGRWFINLEQQFQLMDLVWSDLVLLMIGESLVNSNIVCGAVVNVRTKKPNKVSLWTSNKNEKDVMEIGRHLKQMLQIRFRLQFLDHKNSCLYTV